MKAIAFIFQWQNGKFVQVLPDGARLGADPVPEAELVKGGPIMQTARS